MYREKVFVCPVNLDELDHLPPALRRFALQALQREGIGRVSFVRRGGLKDPMLPKPDEAMFIYGTGGMFPKDPEVRYGSKVEKFASEQSIPFADIDEDAA